MDFDGGSEMFRTVAESGLNILADSEAVCQKKSVLYYDKELCLSRLIVCSVLNEYVTSKLSPSAPVKCIDVIGCTGINGLLWKKMLGDAVEVFINDSNTCTTNFIRKNAATNDLKVHVLNKDPAVALHESGYSFIYLNCNSEAYYYFDAAFRNISRNGIVVITTKDDPSLQGSNKGVARRRYGGVITRTNYSYELAIRLVISSLVWSAAKYNKGIRVICCYCTKGSFTIVVSIQKGPAEADSCLDNIKQLAHCMECGERKFLKNIHNLSSQERVKLHCGCPESGVILLGPVWSGNLYDVDTLEKILSLIPEHDAHLQTLFKSLYEEARCGSYEKKEVVIGDAEEPDKKRAKAIDVSPPFYYNLHQLKFAIERLPTVSNVVATLRKSGYRASKTHFCKLSVRTDANMSQLKNIISDNKYS